MTAPSPRRDAPGRDGESRPALQVVGDNAAMGAILLALGFCCAGSLLGFAAIWGAMAAVAGFVTGFFIGPTAFATAFLIAGSGAIAGLRRQRRRRRSPR